MSHYDDDDDDAASFFFSASAQDKKQFQEDAEEQQNEEQSKIINNLRQDSAPVTKMMTTATSSFASLLTPSEVIEISLQLVKLCKEAPKALQDLAINNNNNGENSKILTKISTSELRRQQNKLSEWSSSVAVPLQKLSVKWEEVVFPHTKELLQLKDEDSAADAMKQSLESGNEAISEIRTQKYVEQLKQVIGERKRELRLTEDLLNVGVW